MSDDARFEAAVKAHAAGKLDTAEPAYRALLADGHRTGDCLANLSMIRFVRQDYSEAQKLAKAATQAAPDDANAWNNLGLAFRALGNLQAAREAFTEALQREPRHRRAWSNLGQTLDKLGDAPGALAAFERAVRLSPDWTAGNIQYVYRKLSAADWGGLDEAINRISAQLKNKATDVDPFLLLFICNDPAELQLAARQLSSKITRDATAIAPQSDPLPGPVFYGARKIRIGYVSANFNDHAVALHILQVIESHDPAQFDVFAYCHSAPASPTVRARLEAAGVSVRRIKDLSDAEAHRRIREDGIEVLVDLMGFTSGARLGIFALRPAPVQITWIGFAGTLGAEWMDYIVADRVVVPHQHEEFFDEKLIRMPGSYQANDNTRAIHSPLPGRSAYNLPESGPLLCCFNKPTKLNPDVLGTWAEILKRVPEAHLWLWEQNGLVGDNLRRAFRDLGVAEERILMARTEPMPVHLARHAMCDLFLDSFPYGGHATATSALYGGCPVLAMEGRTFASRVSASLLTALEMDDLIARSPAEYVRKAVVFINDPHRIATTKARLRALRSTDPFFDGTVFAAHFERALIEAVKTSRAGQQPRHIDLG